MTTQHGLLILHLSDLHFGNQNRFADRDVAKLGKAFYRAVEHARTQATIPAQVQLVVISGDVAETGKRKEFEQAALFLDSLSGEIGLDQSRFVFAPGNHDLSWPLCKKVAADQEIEDFDDTELRRQMDAVKFQFYDELLARHYGMPLADVAGRRPLEAGGCLHNYPELRLSVAALNTSELESHRPEDHRGHLSRQQAETLMETWRRDPYLGWLKIVVVHHNPIAATPANIQDWTRFMKSQPDMAAERIDHYAADVVGFEGRELLERIVRDCRAHLVLHGHHHDQGEPIEWPWSKGDGRAPVLSTGSWGLIDGKLPGDAPPACQLLLLTPDAAQPRLEAYPLVYNGRFRLEGDLLPGNFVADSAGRGRYSQPLHLPAAWSQAAASPATTATMSDAVAAFVRRYRQRMGPVFEQWDLRYTGVAQGGGAARPIDARLDDIYQPLRLAQGVDPTETDRGQVFDLVALQKQLNRATSERKRLSRRSSRAAGHAPRTASSKPQLLAIRGPAGSGKTTWMRYTFRRLLEQDGMLPLLIVLRDVAQRWNEPECQGVARSLDAFLDAWVAQYVGQGLQGHLAELLDAAHAGLGPQIVLLVDGWDELGPLGVEFRDKLLGFCRDHSHVVVVVSSRPYGEGRPTASDGFLTLDIQPLSPPEIDAFAERFFRLCYRADEPTCCREVAQFRTALNRSPEAAALAQTALLLTMMLLISRSEQLPDKRHLLYDRCLYNLLTALPNCRQKAGVLLTEYQWRPDDSEVRQQVTAALAFGVQSAGYTHDRRSAIVLKWDEMAAALPSAWKQQQRDGFLRWLAGPAGVLTDRADGTLVFAHLSFQEYLAAWHLNATVVSPDDVSERFVALAQHPAGWETLLLWAAMISGQSPERLTTAMERLLDEPYGPSLVGMMAADGTGTDGVCHTWAQHFAKQLLGSLPEEWERCLRAWNASCQEERKRRFCESLLGQSPQAGWLGWLRLDETRKSVDRAAELLLPDNAAAAGVIMALNGSLGEPALAAGRILCGGDPLWLRGRSEVAWLQTWPSHRRLAGLRLQQAIACGISCEEVSAVARRELPPPCWTSENRDLVRYLCRRLPGNVAHDWARDWARYLTRDVPLDWARYWARYWASYLGRYLTLDWPLERIRNWARNLVCDLAPDLSRDLCHDLAPCTIPAWKLDFLGVEFFAPGRALARWATALSRTDQGLRPAGLSLVRPEADLQPKLEALGQCDKGADPLWLALSRHLARRSTDEDRALLIDLAQHPEKCEPPLRWGLQYIVRGDLLLADGSVLTLDELADEVGLPHLPYLDEMEPEIELD